MQSIARIIVFVLAILFALATLRFFILPIEQANPEMAHHVMRRGIVFYLHVIFASLALALGVAQFQSGLRAARPALHRWTGRLYAASVGLAAPAGLILALAAAGGTMAAAGFSGLALAWAGATTVAVVHARARRIAIHRRWMIRSYALTLAAVSLRLQAPVLSLLYATNYTGVSPIVAWSCWLPNILIAEWLIRRQSFAVQPNR